MKTKRTDRDRLFIFFGRIITVWSNCNQLFNFRNLLTVEEAQQLSDACDLIDKVRESIKKRADGAETGSDPSFKNNSEKSDGSDISDYDTTGKGVI